MMIQHSVLVAEIKSKEMKNMFCNKCGNQLAVDAKFCNKCGNQMTVKSQAAQQVNSNVQVQENEVVAKTQVIPKKNLLIAGAGTLTIIVALILIFSGGGRRYINVVRNGSFNFAQHITVGDAFHNFYGNSDWSHATNNRGENIVTFTGHGTLSGIPATFEWDFLVQGSSFEIVSIRQNGITQGIWLVDTWLGIVFP